MKQKISTRNSLIDITLAPQHVKSPIKAPRQWPPSQLLLRIHFLIPHLPKTCNGLKTHYAIDWDHLVDGVFMMKKKPLMLESYINLTTECSQYQDKWICDETLYRLLNAHYPHLKNTFVFTREALNRVLSAKAGPCIAPNELSLYSAKFCTECPYSNQRRIVSFYFRQVNGIPPSDPKYAQDLTDTIAKTNQLQRGCIRLGKNIEDRDLSSNRSRGRSISSWDRQHYHTKEKGAH